jgi:plastocyanin
MNTSSKLSRPGLRAAVVAAVAFLVLALAMSQSAPASTSGQAEASGSAEVVINHFAYHPKTLDISKGTKVVFSNTSTKAHTATRAGSFDTGHIKPGTSVSVRFTQKGVFAYHCKIHPFMHGKIVVG